MWFENFIKNEEFFHHFQPIYNLNGWRVIGYEVLLRSNIFPNPEAAFELARRNKQLYELDSRSIHKAVLTYLMAGFSKRDGKLFINVFPSTLQNKDFHSFIDNIMYDYHLSSQQIVLEICESEQILDMKGFVKIINELKRNGISIALDDVGKGHGDIQKIIELEPDFIKLDQYFADDLPNSKKKQDIIKSLMQYCDRFQSQLILEGLETLEELNFAKRFGILLGQGYVLGKPENLKRII